MALIQTREQNKCRENCIISLVNKCRENCLISLVMADDSGMPRDPTITSKRKHCTREHKLEFSQLFKKYGNKNRAAKEFQLSKKVESNS